MQRFVAVSAGAGRTDAWPRLLWSSLALYALAGVVAAPRCALLAPALVDFLDVRPGLRADATAMFRLTGPVVAAALLAAALGNVQQGLERFRGFAVSASPARSSTSALMIVLLDAGLRAARPGVRRGGPAGGDARCAPPRSTT